MAGEAVAARSSGDVARWYAHKTEALLSKYGPGPRVHYHTGAFEGPVPCTASVDSLHSAIVTAQVRLLEIAARTWQADVNLCGDILDVGCGLGGGAIFWAERYGARVVALTNVPLHAGLVARFARAAQVPQRVIPLVGDACTTPVSQTFDAVVAMEASCYLPRFVWMKHVAGLLRPGGRLFIADVFATVDEIRGEFDRDWKTCVGSRSEYGCAADRAGMSLESTIDLTGATRDYWTLSLAYLHALRATPTAPRSIARHRRLLHAWCSGALEYRLLEFLLSE